MSDVVKRLASYCRPSANYQCIDHLGFPGPFSHEGRTVVCDGVIVLSAAGRRAGRPEAPDNVVTILETFAHTKDPYSVTGDALRAWAGPTPLRWENLEALHLVSAYAGRVGRAVVDRRYLAILADDCAPDEPVTIARVDGLRAMFIATARWAAVLMHLSDGPKDAPRLRLKRAA